MDIHTLQEQFQEVYQTEYKKMYAVVYRITYSHHDTEEALQEGFIRAFRRLSTFDGKAKLSTWIYRIVINESYRFMKTWHKLPLTAIREELGMSERDFFQSLESPGDFTNDLIVHEMREKCMHGFLNCVPQKGRACFLLKTIMGLKNRDIAQVLETSESNVKVLLHRTRKQLREMYEMRCSLVDPSKPCKCALWIKYMRDTDRPFKEDNLLFDHSQVLLEHDASMTTLQKMNQLYKADLNIDEQVYFEKLKKISENL